MFRLLRLAIAICLALGFNAAISPSYGAETFEVIHTAAPAGIAPAGAPFLEEDGSFLITANIGGIGGRGGVFRMANGAVNHVASFYGANGTFPANGVIKASDGNYYGTTLGGGNWDAGTVFRLTPAGTLTKLANLAGKNGFFPECQLVEGNDGALYGLASLGGNNGRGTVFKVTKAGAISTLVHFNGSNGAGPSDKLTKMPDGTLYGVTSDGGTHDKGTIFRVSPGGAFSVVANFEGSNGANPIGALALGSDGFLYGTTSAGGANDKGAVFRLSTAGVLEVLASFDWSNGSKPNVRLVELGTGNFYGATELGGVQGGGVIFKVTSTGTITVVSEVAVNGTSMGGGPLIAGSDGALYRCIHGGGVNSSGELLRITTAGSASTVASLGSVQGMGFVGNLAVRENDNALYGTTLDGGSSGAGAFFKITLGGEFSKLADFDYSTLGGWVTSGVAFGADGNFYGTTMFGGSGPAVFQATPQGVITRVGAFSDIGGEDPIGIMQASDGTFYGTTQGGGSKDAGLFYSYTAQNGLTKLKEFGTTEAVGASGQLVEGSDGYLYGTSTNGGASDVGTVYRLSPDGEFTLLASFNSKNGAYPVGRLVQAADGNFYGMTIQGGIANAGVIFRVTPQGKLSVLAQFTGYNGAFPQGGLTVGARGDLYGVAAAGGSHELGTLFKVSLKGKVTVLKHFDGTTTGAFPQGSLTLGPDRNFYGTTYNTIFRLSLDNRPPVPKDDIFQLPAFNLKVLKNDVDPDKDALQIVSAETSDDATVIINPDNTISYLPGPGFSGTGSFTYAVSDGLSEPVTATVTILTPQNPLQVAAGAYAGMISDGDGNIAGYWGIVVSKKGLFTGRLRFQGQEYRVLGATINGQIQLSIPRPGQTDLVIAATLDIGRNQVQGTLSAAPATSYNLLLYGTKPFFTHSSPAPQAGRYTVLLPASGEADPDFPQGSGHATMNVTATGIVTVVGKLGDGTAFSTASLISQQSNFPLYAELYKKRKGYLAGLVTFANSPVTEATAVMLWSKPAQSDKYYPNGFTVQPGFLASRYAPPAKNTTVVPLNAPPGNATLELMGTGIEKTLSISSRNLVSVTNPGADKLSMTIAAKTGVFAGKFIDPADGKKRSFGGVFFQKTSRAEGTSMGQSTTGAVFLDPVP